MKKIILTFLLTSMILLQANIFYYEHGKKVELKEVKEIRSNVKGITYYKTVQGNKLGVTDEIIVQCKKNIDCFKLLEDQGFINISKLSSILFLLKVGKNENVFTLSQKLYKQSEIIMAHPNFTKQRIRR